MRADARSWPETAAPRLAADDLAHEVRPFNVDLFNNILHAILVCIVILSFIRNPYLVEGGSLHSLYSIRPVFTAERT